jgi:hypothetical protein
MYQYFDHTQSDVHDMAMVGYNAGAGSNVNPDGNVSYGYMYRSKYEPNRFIAFQTRGLRYGDNNSVDGMRLGVNAVPGYTYDFAVGGKSHFGNTLTITESGAGTAASGTGGTLTLQHTTSNGTGKNSIVFRSATDGTNDCGYIQYEDDGGSGSSDENGKLTIGVRNDTVNYGGSDTATADQINFDIAGASAHLESKANSTGGNKGSRFTTNAVRYLGIYADSYPLDTIWGTTLTGYSSASSQNRSALYQYIDNAHDSDHDLAFTGMNGPGGSTVDGSSKPYGYMLRSKANGYIAYQTEWLDGPYNATGFALGVNALPGRYYDFAVGGKSYFGNGVDISGGLTVSTGAGIFTGESTGYNSTTNPAGIYIGKYVN